MRKLSSRERVAWLSSIIGLFLTIGWATPTVPPGTAPATPPPPPPKATQKRTSYGPSFAVAKTNREANQLFKQGDYDGALSGYTDAQSLDPDLSQIDYNIGNVLYEKGKNDDAIEQFRRAADTAPKTPEGAALASACGRCTAATSEPMFFIRNTLPFCAVPSRPRSCGRPCAWRRAR